MLVDRQRLILSAALVLVACGGDDDDDGGEGAASAPWGLEPQPPERRDRSHPRVGGTEPAGTGGGGDCVVGVSWNNYQEERWAKWDEPALKAAIEEGGGTYISNDAKLSAETQASNVENLISQGANVLVILAQDGTAISLRWPARPRKASRSSATTV